MRWVRRRRMGRKGGMMRRCLEACVVVAQVPMSALVPAAVARCHAVAVELWILW